MLAIIHGNKKVQLAVGLAIGIAFGFLLQKGNVTEYDVILGQLLLRDFTVLKVMLTASAVGMIGLQLLRQLGLVTLHPKPGGLGTSLLGGLLFGIGFAVLGYCPGTIVAAIGQGNLDAFVGGFIGILVGAAIFAHLFPHLQKTLSWRDFGTVTLPELLGVNAWMVVAAVTLIIISLLFWIENRF